MERIKISGRCMWHAVSGHSRLNYLTSTRGAPTARIVKRVSRRYRVTLVRARVAHDRHGRRRRRGGRVGRGKAEEVAGIVVAPGTAIARLQGQGVITS